MAGGTATGGGSACNPLASPPVNAVFVTPGGNDTSTGDAISPVQTVARALELAFATIPTRPIVLSDEVFAQDLRFKNLDAGVRVLGGYQRVAGSVWQRGCRGPSTFNTPNPLGLFAENTAALELSDLTVQAASPNSKDGIIGDSSFAAAVHNATVTFTNTNLRAGNGGDGGTPATPAAPTASPCSVFSQAAQSLPGAVGVIGAQGAVGSFSVAEYAPVQAPSGTPGQDGGVGVAGQAGMVATNCAVGCSCGLSMSCMTVARANIQGGQGLAGCGGTGGLPGPGGGGGGASVGLLVTGASRVAIERSFVQAGAGGNGALGASGGPGAPGSFGLMGMSNTCWTDCTGTCGPGGTCGLGAGGGAMLVAAGGPAGGRGATGGSGGPGGAGAGGPSYGIVIIGVNAVISSDAGVTFGLGGGWGGDPVRRAPAGQQVGF